MQTTLIIAILVGLLLGGIANLVVQRLPRERRLGGWPRCTRCGRPLSWWQALPILGWLLQLGRARCCGRRLHWITPAVELITLVSVVLIERTYGMGALFAYLSFVALILIITGAIDWLHRWIYTAVILGGAAIAFAGSYVVPEHSLMNAMLGILVAGFLFVIFFVLARMLFPSAATPFGLGDVYLAIFIGAAFGISRLGPALLGGMLAAGLYAGLIMVARGLRKPTPTNISYGTFLCLGALALILAGGFTMN